MVKTFTRVFPIAAKPSDLLALASLPLLGPNYLNFLERIERSNGQDESRMWTSYEVWIVYKAILKTKGMIEHFVDAAQNKVTLRHNGDIAMFVSTFQIKSNEVHLTCTYEAKIPLTAWLVARVLDRALIQSAAAMDRYAASRALGPQ
jgi:hypothetical protein